MMRFALHIISLIAGQAAVAQQGVEDANVFVQQKVESAVNSQAQKSAQLLAEASERMILQAHETVWNALDKPHKRRPYNRHAPSYAEAANLFKEGTEYVLDSLSNFTEEAAKRKADDKAAKEPVLVQHSFRGMSLLAVELYRILDTLITGRNCFFTNFILFFVLGGVVLVREEHLSPADAVLVLFQQMTSVGYGSNPPKNTTDRVYTDTDLRIWKIFHGLHAWFGNLLVNKPMIDGWKSTIQTFERLLTKKFSVSRSVLRGFETILSVLFWSAIYSADQGNFVDAFYLTLMTMSTVGYGDYAPENTWAKWMSPFAMIMGTNTYGDLANQLQGKFDPTTSAAANKGTLPEVWDTWKSGLDRLYVECWESNKDITVTFRFNLGQDEDGEDIVVSDKTCADKGTPDPRKIVTGLSHGWKLPLGLDISVLPFNKARKEGASCVFHMRLNNVPWQKIDAITKQMMLDDMGDPERATEKAAVVYRRAECMSEDDGERFCIACKKAEKCVKVHSIQAHNLHMPIPR